MVPSSDSVPLLIEFAAGTRLFREPDLAQGLTILHNGPPGTFVTFPDGLGVSLPTDQPEDQLSPARSRTMVLSMRWVASISIEGHEVWPSR
jgi:hypothetical protein